jgi:hypothetical protein
MADYMGLSRMKADAFFDPGMRSWRYYDEAIQGLFYTNREARAAQGGPFVYIGYVPAFYLTPGLENQSPDFNWTIVPQPVQVGVIVLPAPNASERVLTAGIIRGGSTQFWNGLSTPFHPITNITDLFGEYGPVNHPKGSPWIPAGENLGMLDGSAKWRKFKEMRPRQWRFLWPDGKLGGGEYWW